MHFLRRQLPLIFLAVATIASGAIAGVFGNRWGAPSSLTAASQRFANFPDRVGEWQLEKAEPFAPEITEILECAGSTSRIYRHRVTGQVIRVAMQVGPTGPTAVHTPDVCLSSHDFEQVSGPARIQVLTSSRGGGSFWKADYRARTLEGGAAHLIYGWSTGSGWMAAERPRFEFVGHRLLYKLQLSLPFVEGENDDSEDAYRGFLNELLPRLAADVLTPSAT